MKQPGYEPIHSKFHADPLYQPLILDFLADLQQLGSDLKDTIERSDWLAAQQLCHQLKGTAATYGYDDLASIVSDIEVHSKHESGVSDNSMALMKKLDNLIKRMLAAKSQL